MQKTRRSEPSIEQKIRDFSELLDQLDTLSDKKKRLWKEIYENALSDRNNAHELFLELTEIVQGKSTEHAVHGKALASYLERMSKANDQIIRLAELVAKSETATQESIDPEEIFRKLEQ